MDSFEAVRYSGQLRCIPTNHADTLAVYLVTTKDLHTYIDIWVYGCINWHPLGLTEFFYYRILDFGFTLVIKEKSEVIR